MTQSDKVNNPNNQGSYMNGDLETPKDIFSILDQHAKSATSQVELGGITTRESANDMVDDSNRSYYQQCEADAESKRIMRKSVLYVLFLLLGV